MEDLTTEELKQLLAFYRQRYYESEYNNLQLQVKLNRVSDSDKNKTS